MDVYLEGLSTEEKELRVLDYELKTLKKGRHVFVQQPNSNIYFLCKTSEAMNQLEQAREKLGGESSQKCVK